MTARLAGLTVLAALLGLAFPVAPASAGPAREHRDPTALPRGHDARITWLSGRVVHTRGGREIVLGLPASRAPHLELLGRSDGGAWVVVDQDGWTARVKVVTPRGSRTIFAHTDYEPPSAYSLSRRGDRVLEWYSDRASGSTGTLIDLDGKVVAKRTFDDYADVIGTGRDGVLLSTPLRTVLWTPDEHVAELGPSAQVVDRRHDLLFAETADGAGPTSLADPGTPGWTAPFEARAVSPDGEWVAGYGRRSLEVRSLADGARQPRPGVRVPWGAPIAWERPGTLLVVVSSRAGHALVRCTVAGRCERASDWQSAPISLPYANRYFGDTGVIMAA